MSAHARQLYDSLIAPLLSASPTRCLIDRLEKQKEEIMRFFHDFHVPFDNNQAERDIRQFNVKLKMARCFRTLSVAQGFAKINSALSNIKKHGLNVYDSVPAMLKQPDYIPWGPTKQAVSHIIK